MLLPSTMDTLKKAISLPSLFTYLQVLQMMHNASSLNHSMSYEHWKRPMGPVSGETPSSSLSPHWKQPEAFSHFLGTGEKITPKRCGVTCASILQIWLESQDLCLTFDALRPNLCDQLENPNFKTLPWFLYKKRCQANALLFKIKGDQDSLGEFFFFWWNLGCHSIVADSEFLGVTSRTRLF